VRLLVAAVIALAAYVLARLRRKDPQGRVVVGWRDGSEVELRPGTPERDRLVEIAGGVFR
jgi:hypothetical protein